MEDTQAEDIQLRYFRDRDKREVDFVIVQNGLPVRFIECKSAQKGTSGSLRYIKQRFPDVDCVQVCLEQGRDVRTAEGIRSVPAHIFLREFV
jgi:hypothetical protein